MSLLEKYVEAQSETLKVIKEAQINLEEERDLLQLWNFMEYDKTGWFEHHMWNFDIQATEFIV